MKDIMDNKQVTDTEIAWLAGIIDGEGSVGVSGRAGKAHQTVANHNLVARIQIMNTSARMIEKIENICDRLNIPHYVKSYDDRFPHHKPAFGIQLGRLTAVRDLLLRVLPYLVCKDAQARLALRYVESRLASGAQQGNPTKQPYTEEELDIVKQLKELNRRGNPQRPYVA